MSIIIRPAIIADYEALCALWDEGDTLHRTALPDVFRMPDTGPTRDSVQSLIDGPESTILVAAEADEILGLLTLVDEVASSHRLKQNRRYALIVNMVVKSSARRRGIGRKLVAAAVTWAKKRGLTAIELNVFAFNAGAAAFYRELGFETLSLRLSRKV